MKFQNLNVKRIVLGGEALYYSLNAMSINLIFLSLIISF